MKLILTGTRRPKGDQVGTETIAPLWRPPKQTNRKVDAKRDKVATELEPKPKG